MDVAELVFRREGKALLHVRLSRAETCIGSHPTNDVLLPDPSLPDVAAVLIDHGSGQFQVRDLTGGKLKVNGQDLDADETPLKSGDRMTLGSFELELRLRPEAEVAKRKTTILNESAKSIRPAIVTFQGQRHVLQPGQAFNIGGDDDNDLTLEDEFVSSFHCRITFSEGRWTLIDLASTNGTLINGMRVGQAELPSPSTIVVGHASLHFELEAPKAEDEGSATLVFSGMVARSAKMRRVFELVQRMADAPSAVLVSGQSGSGKELVARALHDISKRANGPFVAINCGALAASLIESELFGHTKGAFTGATADKKGAFETARDGTLFLDEIGELPLELQPKLLRVLEQQTIRRVGGTSEIPVNARVVAATHRSLHELVQSGSFREDLFHRLYVLCIDLPPLAERPEDVLPLAQHFLQSNDTGRALSLSPDAEAALVHYPWPGNVRELRNVILRAMLMADTQVITKEGLQFSGAGPGSGPDARSTVRRAAEAERDRVLAALEEAGNNRAEAARILGVSKSTFHDRLKRLGIPLKFSAKK